MSITVLFVKNISKVAYLYPSKAFHISCKFCYQFIITLQVKISQIILMRENFSFCEVT